MTYWMSPWRQGVRDHTPSLIADVAPSRAQKRYGREVVIPLTAAFRALDDNEKARVAWGHVEATLAILTPQENPQ